MKEVSAAGGTVSMTAAAADLVPNVRANAMVTLGV